MIKLIVYYFCLEVMILTLLILILLIIFYFLMLIYVVRRMFIGIPSVKTKESDLRELLLDEKISKDDVVYDLGSGMGETIFTIEKLSGAKTYGYEVNFISYLLSIIVKKIKKYKTEIYFMDFLKINLSRPTLIYIYLSQEIMPLIESVFEKKLRSKTRVVSCDFTFPNILPDRVHEYKRHKFYVYVF